MVDYPPPQPDNAWRGLVVFATVMASIAVVIAGFVMSVAMDNAQSLRTIMNRQRDFHERQNQFYGRVEEYLKRLEERS
jgi:hypothetical protein